MYDCSYFLQKNTSFKVIRNLAYYLNTLTQSLEYVLGVLNQPNLSFLIAFIDKGLIRLKFLSQALKSYICLYLRQEDFKKKFS